MSADRRQFVGGADAAIPRPPGAIVGDRYRIVRVLARGGTGVVYEAEHTWTGRRVAVKMLLPRLAEGEEPMARFRQEAKSAARLVHPNIIDIVDMGCDAEDGALFIVHSLLAGEDLEQRLERAPRLGAEELLRVVRPILDALRVAHQHGVLHRDLKPSNIFLARVRDGGYPQTPGAPGSSSHPPEIVPTLIDFGAAKRLDEGADFLRLTQSGALVGTPIYMSPEQLRGEVLDARSDIWSIGVVMYRALMGRHPFDGPSFPVLVNQILSVRAPAIADPAVPRIVAAVVYRALATRREERFASVAAMIEALDAPEPARVAVAPKSEDPTLLEAGLHDELARARAELFTDELTNVPAENERVDESIDDGGSARRSAELRPQTPGDDGGSARRSAELRPQTPGDEPTESSAGTRRPPWSDRPARTWCAWSPSPRPRRRRTRSAGARRSSSRGAARPGRPGAGTCAWGWWRRRASPGGTRCASWWRPSTAGGR